MGTQIMGILNVTPDSFSDGGRYNSIENALIHAREMVAEGADIIDVGGESTRPGYQIVSAEDEIARVVPVIERIRQEMDIHISIDTCKGEVARAAIEAGADIVNDIWGLKWDDVMADVVRESDVRYVMMHNRKSPDESWDMDDFMNMFEEDIQLAMNKGIDSDKIIYDPGIGFAKTQEQNLCILANLARLKELGVPVLLGASRKSVIGYVSDLPASERLPGTLATSAAAVNGGCDYVRVHDVGDNYRFIQMYERILASK